MRYFGALRSSAACACDIYSYVIDIYNVCAHHEVMTSRNLISKSVKSHDGCAVRVCAEDTALARRANRIQAWNADVSIVKGLATPATGSCIFDVCDGDSKSRAEMVRNCNVS